MSKNKSQIYLKATKQWVPVTEEFHKAYFHEVDLFRRKQIRSGYCNCPSTKWWLCDMNCAECEFSCHPGNVVSIDSEIGDGSDACPLADAIPDDSVDIEETMMLAELFSALHSELERLDPDGRRICELIMAGKTEREAASLLGISKTAYRYQWLKLKDYLAKKLQDYI